MRNLGVYLLLDFFKFSAFMGIYLSEGSLDKQIRKSDGVEYASEVRIHQNLGTNFDLILDLVSSMGFEKVTVLNLEQMIDYAEGGVVSKQVIKTDSGNLTLFSFDEGQGLTEHTSPYNAVVQVLDGQAEISINRQPHILKAGQTIIMPANVPHALHAIKRFKMLLSMVKG